MHLFFNKEHSIKFFDSNIKHEKLYYKYKDLRKICSCGFFVFLNIVKDKLLVKYLTH